MECQLRIDGYQTKNLYWKCTNYFTNLGVAEIKLETQNLKTGDEIIITGPTTGVIQSVVSEIRYEMNPVDEGQKGQHISVPVVNKLRRSDKVYKLVNAEKVKSHR